MPVKSNQSLVAGTSGLKAVSDPRVIAAEQALGLLTQVKRTGDEPGGLVFLTAWVTPQPQASAAAGEAADPLLGVVRGRPVGSAAGSLLAALAVWLPPALTWHRAQVLG